MSGKEKDRLLCLVLYGEGRIYMEEITNEFIERIIDETIEFDKRLKNPDYLKHLELEKERIKNLDISMFFEN